MGRYKVEKYVLAPYDYKLYNLVSNFGRENRILKKDGNINIRKSSSHFADFVEQIRWENIAIKKRKL